MQTVRREEKTVRNHRIGIYTHTKAREDGEEGAPGTTEEILLQPMEESTTEQFFSLTRVVRLSLEKGGNKGYVVLFVFF